MDIMFPPVSGAIGHGVDVHTGHAYVPPLTSGAIQVDHTWLAVELPMIVVAADMK